MAGFITDAKVNRHFGRELSYVLPREQVSAFPPLFTKLEELVGSGTASLMGFESYGVSMTTLEEVFLKLGEEAELAEKSRMENEAKIKKNGLAKNEQSE